MTAFDIRDVLDAASSLTADGAGVAANKTELSTSAVPTAESVATFNRRKGFSPVLLTGFIRVFEALLTALLGTAIHQIYLAPDIPFSGLYFTLILSLAAVTVIAFQAAGAYTIPALRGFLRISVRLIFAWLVVFSLALAFVFFSKLADNLSRVWLASWFFSGIALIFVNRMSVSAILGIFARAGRFDRHIAIVGGGEYGEAMIRALESQPDSGIKIVGVFDDRNDDRSPNLVAGHPKLGTVEDLVAYARRTGLDLVIFTLPIAAEGRILQMLTKLWILPIDIRLSAHSSRLRLRPRSYSYIGEVPVLDVYDKPIADWDLVFKWLFDRLVGALLLVMLSPIMLATALAVKLTSRGPVLFRQRRYGFNNELIEVYKFRSMYVEQCDATASKLVTRNDPRVTPVGRFIRKTSLDELPQLFNVVFKGNLSLVGPRPHALHAKAEDRLYDQVVDGYFARHKVKPGITGWAQIKGWRGETDTQEKIQRRVEHDIYYIENWSVLLDLSILCATPFALMKTGNAY
jgi:Undecaprenyl-phosphate glucose phosphotransferase